MKSDAPTKFEVWATKMKGGTIKAVMFDNVKELVAGRMKSIVNTRDTD